MLAHASSYEAVRAGFRWRIPERYNIGVDVVDRHAGGDALALIEVAEDGRVRRWRFVDVLRAAGRLGNVLDHHGVAPGDRVGILLAQSPEAAIAHVAAYRGGLIAIPLFTLFGDDALAFRLADSGARVLITEAASLPKIARIRDRLPDLALVLVVGLGADGDGSLDFDRALDRARDQRPARDTAADDPALIIYTSGTTGDPKGALHAHRVLLGHLPGVEFPHEFFPQPGDLFWTPADWAWIGGLLDVLLPSWHHGVPVLAHRMAKFDPERAFALIAQHGVRNLFLPPTACKLMRQVAPAPAVAVRTVGSGGETVGAELLEWGRRTFGTTINEFYGQTECNLVVANCAAVMAARPGAMGRAVPGHDVAVVDRAGREVRDGELGLVAVKRPDPVMFLGYWQNPEATRQKFAGDWLLTGDQARRDADGYFWFVGRDDDVITSGGYRIGPGEIEDCLIKHPAVAMAAVVGVPDPLRTEIVKAFIVLNPGQSPDDALVGELQNFVKTRLAAHEYPRRIEFVDTLPLTATGKIIRRELRARG
ncbi:MAG: acyl-CoA synthetase [Proteobacteria bacterium]|nr:acyl-CoA synthetase [Pseudomonadota bacterium]